MFTNIKIKKELFSLSKKFATDSTIKYINKDKCFTVKWTDKSYDPGVNKFCNILIKNLWEDSEIVFDKYSIAFSFKRQGVKKEFLKKLCQLNLTVN